MNTALIKLQRKGQMVIPRSLREQVGVSEGTLMEVAVVEGGRLLITPQVALDRAILADPKKNRKQLLQALSAAVTGIRQEAKRIGLAKVTMPQIEAEVAAYRRAKAKEASEVTRHMIRVVLDTNVLVSALISRQGPNALVLDMVLADRIRLCVSEAVLGEYRGVLSRPKFSGINSSHIGALIDLLEAVSLKVAPVAALQVSRDEDDNRVYECADAARAHYIVTGNKQHFAAPYKSIKIVNARELLDILSDEDQPR